MDNLLFRWKTRLYFSESDPAGIMFYSRAMEMSHKAWEEFISEKANWNIWFNNTELAFPIVETNCKYHSPCKAGIETTVEIYLLKLGSSSLQVCLKAFQDNKECFEQNISFVCVDKLNFKAHPLPNSIKQNLFQ